MSLGPQLTWSVSPLLFQRAGLSVRWFTVLWMSELVIGYWLLARQIGRGGGDDEDASDLAVYSWIGLFVGARLGHWLLYDWAALRADPSRMLSFQVGGLSSHGGLLGCLLAVLLFARRRALPPLDVTDRMTFACGVSAIVHRVANLFNSEIVGIPTDGSWGVQFPLYDASEAAPLRHPMQLYEATLGVLLLSLLWLADRRWGREARPRGALTGLALVSYFSARFVLEFWKEPQGTPLASLDTGQWLSLPFILAGAVLLQRSLRHRQPAGWRLTSA